MLRVDSGFFAWAWGRELGGGISSVIFSIRDDNFPEKYQGETDRHPISDPVSVRATGSPLATLLPHRRFGAKSAWRGK